MKISRSVSRPRTIWNTSKLHPVPETAPLTRKCNKNAAWIGRGCRVRGRALQGAARHAEALHLKEANRALEEATQSADRGLAFDGGAVKWSPYTIVLAVTGASWAGGEDVVSGRIEPLRSQRARFNDPAGLGFIEGNSDHGLP
eukprot:9469827-Pyramimonas_sp.AAC.1